MDIVGLLIGLSVLFIPGFLVVRWFRPLSFADAVGLSVLFSIAGGGSLIYLVSLLTPFRAEYLYALLTLGIGFLYVQRRHYTGIIHHDARHTRLRTSHAVGLMLLTFLVFFSLFSVLRHDDRQFDSLNYHLPFIQDFSENGQSTYYPTPENNFEMRSNWFPKLYEGLAGIIHRVSEEAFQLLPVLVWGLSLILIWMVTRIVSKKESVYPVLFFGMAYLVFLQAISYYVDLLLVCLFLGFTYLLLRHKEKMPGPNLVFAFFLLGSMMAIKLTSVILVPILLAWLLFVERNDWKNTAKLFHYLTAFLAGGGYYLFVLGVPYLLGDIDLFRLTAGNTGLIFGELFWEQLFRNIWNFFLILFYLSILGYFPVLFFVVLGASMAVPLKGLESYLKKFWLFVGGIFFLYLVFTSSNVRMDTFPRFILPLVGLGTVFVGLTWQKWMDATLVRPSNFWKTGFRFLLLLALTLMLLISFYRATGVVLTQEIGKGGLPDIVYDSIPNQEGVMIYFANTPNTLNVGLERTEIRDYSSYVNTEIPACAFLKSQGVTHVVVFNYTAPRLEFGPFNASIVQESQAGECGVQKASNEFAAIYVLQSWNHS